MTVKRKAAVRPTLVSIAVPYGETGAGHTTSALGTYSDPKGHVFGQVPALGALCGALGCCCSQAPKVGVQIAETARISRRLAGLSCWFIPASTRLKDGRLGK